MEKIMLVEYFVRAPKWNRVWDQRCVIMGSRPAHSPRAWSQFWQVSLDGFRAHFSALCIEVLVLQVYHIARWQSWKYKPPGSTEYLQYGHVCTPYLNVWRTWIQVQMFDHPTGIYSRGRINDKSQTYTHTAAIESSNSEDCVGCISCMMQSHLGTEQMSRDDSA
jgi:hypothetical protein